MREGRRQVSPKRRSSGNNFVLQGSLLAVAGILVRLIGMVTEFHFPRLFPMKVMDIILQPFLFIPCS